MAKASKKAKQGKPAKRKERRFLPQSTTNANVVYGLGAVGALLLGAGTWAQWGRQLVLKNVEEPLPFGVWLVVAAAVTLAAAIWLGTSGEPALRVGDAGVGVEKNNVVKRLAWWQIEKVSYDGGASAIVVNGVDDGGSGLEIRARVASQPQAAAWIVAEAKARVASAVDVGENVTLPEPNAGAGEAITLDPIQVVGKRCAASRTIIAYEPDARVCPRCERVYHKASVPDECACGESLTGMKPSDDAAS